MMDHVLQRQAVGDGGMRDNPEAIPDQPLRGWRRAAPAIEENLGIGIGIALARGGAHAEDQFLVRMAGHQVVMKRNEEALGDDGRGHDAQRTGALRGDEGLDRGIDRADAIGNTR
ncbi:hypothetical protein D3C72_1993850 [compost metagenome]